MALNFPYTTMAAWELDLQLTDVCRAEHYDTTPVSHLVVLNQAEAILGCVSVVAEEGQ